MGDNKTETTTLAGGCFWCLEAVFEQIQGVNRVASGYSGGHVVQPSYQEVCEGTTGHAEVVQITFNPEIISYREILVAFFAIHDPTTLNQQGIDVGPQYRSAIFHHTQDQKEAAEELIASFGESGTWKNPIVTEVTPLSTFYIAEDYHQQFYQNYKNGTNSLNPPYCEIVITPKLAKFRKEHMDKIKPTIHG